MISLRRSCLLFLLLATAVAIAESEKLTWHERTALALYNGAGHGFINGWLRSRWRRYGTPPLVRALERALGKMPDYAGIVYRGTALTTAALARYQQGTVVEESGFTSSTTERTREALYRYAWRNDLTMVRFIIESRTGKYIAPYLAHRTYEKEVLFPPATRFSVERVERIDSWNGPVVEISLREAEPATPCALTVARSDRHGK